MDERLQFHPCIRAGPELNGGLGGLEPPTSLLSVVTKPSATDCDGLRSCWFSAPVQAIRTLAALLSIVTVLDLGGAQNRAQWACQILLWGRRLEFDVCVRREFFEVRLVVERERPSCPAERPAITKMS